MPTEETSAAREEVARVAETYYDSGDADTFYQRIWGGEDIHIGIYASPDDSIFDASRRTVERMARAVAGLGPGMRVLDLGAGYGGAARWLAQHAGCSVVCLNLSEVQNQTNRRITEDQGLEGQVEVFHGNFEEIPYTDEHFDLVWSQDAILHSGDRCRVLREVRRVLRPGGQLVFTDPMQSDDCPDGVLRAVYERIHLDSLGSFRFYREELARLGMEEVACLDLTPHLRTHYARVGRELRSRYDEMTARATREYVERMLEGLDHWVKAADEGHLAWGILHFRRP